MKAGIVAVSAAAVVMANEVKVTPTEKVVELLSGMADKGKKEKHAEQVQFAAYKQFCDDTSTDKQRAIAEANARMEKLEADIMKFKSDAAKLGREIAAHDKDIATWTGDKNAATKVRDIEAADYATLHKDYSESIDAIGRATEVLKNQDYDRAQAALIQIKAIIPKEDQAALSAFLEQDPGAHGYEFQSGGVIQMLEKLMDKFADQRSELEKAEVNSKHAYDMLIQDLTAEVANATQARTEKSETKGKKLQSAADAKGDLVDTTATRDDDQTYLSDLVATCEQKGSDFENRQQLRADELVAIEKAVEILSSGAVAGAAKKHLPTLVQSSFVQLKSASVAQTSNANNQFKAIEFLKMRAGQMKSKILTQLSAQVAAMQATNAGADPFKKVKKLIQDLIVRLMEEANEEAEHKGWCDTELAANEATRKEKTTSVEVLHAEIDQLQASIAKLTEEIASLTAGVAELDAAMATATKAREEEKATNTETIADSKAAQTATQQAVEVLKEFYAKAGEATSLMQTSQQPESPEIFDEAYTGMQAENGGIVGMLEVIASDFARLEAETTAGEAESQKQYDQFMDDSTIDKTQKNKDIEHKTMKKQNEEQALQEKKGDLEGTQKELDAALSYFDKLKPSCIDSGVSHEDRVARREEEVQSLQEALRILNGEDA